MGGLLQVRCRVSRVRRLGVRVTWWRVAVGQSDAGGRKVESATIHVNEFADPMQGLDTGAIQLRHIFAQEALESWIVRLRTG
jgi:hypothetical protein